MRAAGELDVALFRLAALYAAPDQEGDDEHDREADEEAHRPTCRRREGREAEGGGGRRRKRREKEKEKEKETKTERSVERREVGDVNDM